MNIFFSFLKFYRSFSHIPTYWSCANKLICCNSKVKLDIGPKDKSVNQNTLKYEFRRASKQHYMPKTCTLWYMLTAKNGILFERKTTLDHTTFIIEQFIHNVKMIRTRKNSIWYTHIHFNILNGLRNKVWCSRIPSWIFFLFKEIITFLLQEFSSTPSTIVSFALTSSIFTKSRIASVEAMLSSPFQLQGDMLSLSNI